MKRTLLALLLFLPATLPPLVVANEKNEIAQISVEKYPDADTVIISTRQNIRYNPDATAEAIHESAEKILTEKGRQENRTLSLHFNEHYNQIEIVNLELERDAKIIPIDVKANSRIMTEPGQMNANIYDPNQRILQISIPDLRLGDIIRATYKELTLKSRIKGVWTDFTVFQFHSPALYAELTVDAPAELPLKNIMLKDEIPGTVKYSKTDQKGRTRHTWIARNLPQFFDEPSMPPWYMSAQRLLLSTAADWPEISRWYWDLCEPRMAKITPAMKAKTAELIKSKKTDLEKINAIFQFVAKEIRYSGITVEKEAPGYEPHDVNLTFENRYGVCRDKAALLTAMLREAGFNAFPVLFYSGPRKDAEVPNNYFNHAISAVELKKNEYLLMDSTNETTPEIFPSYLSNMSYLVARPEGETLQTSPITPATKNTLQIKVKGNLDEEGTLNAEAELVFNGINDDVYRGAFSSWNPQQVRQFITRQLGQAVAGATVQNIEILPQDLRDMDQQLRVKIKYSAKNFLVKGSGRALFTVPWLGSHFGVVNFVLGSTGLKERKYPMQIFSTCASSEQFELVFPEAWPAEILPTPQSIDTAVLDWNQKLQYNGKIVSGERNIAFITTEVTPPQYDNLKQALRDIEYEERKTPVFKTVLTTQELLKDANATYLDWDVNFELQNPMEWVRTEKIRKEILTFGGIKENSELKFFFNPACGKIELIDAAVINPDGERKKVTENEINIMDESWVGSAPRYPAGKMMVISLPGVQIGSVIEYTVRSTSENRIPFSLIAVFQDFDPILRKRVTVKYDGEISMQVDERLKTHIEDNIRSWEVNNVPAIKQETALPPLWSFVPTVRMSTVSGTEYASMVDSALNKAAIQDDPSAVVEFSGSTAAKREKIKAIRDDVAKNIRRAGPALNALPLNAIAAPSVTQSSGYGNSADRAVLLASRLRAAGINYKFVLGSSLPKIKEFVEMCNEISVPEFFSEVLVSVDDFGLLNDTDQYTPLGATAHEGTLMMSLVDGKVSGIDALEPNRSESNTEITINDDGSADLTLKEKYSGMNAAGKKRFFSEITPELLKRYEQTLVVSISENATIVKGLTFSLNPNDVTESITVKIDRFAVKDGNYMQFNLPNNPVASLIRALPEKRDNPYLIINSALLKSTYRISLPQSFRDVLMIPPVLSFKLGMDDKTGNNSGLNLRMEHYKEKNILNIDLTAQLNPVMLDELQYPSLVAAQAQLSHPSMNIVLLELK